VLWVFPVLIVILVYEARHMINYKFENCSHTVNSNVIIKAQNLPGEYVLFQLPIAIRNAEANIVMATIGKFPLLVDGWSGFEPDYYRRLFVWEEGNWGVDKISTCVTQIWPPAYLIIDRGWVMYLEKGWYKPFPWNDIWWRSLDLIDKDKGFSLYRQKEVVYDSNQIIRRVRTDIRKAHPLLSFKAHRSISTGDQSPIIASVLLNHKIIKEKIPISEELEEYTIPLLPNGMGNIKGEEIEIELASLASSPAQWEVKDIEFKEFTKE
jgi:hypothetical protein